MKRPRALTLAALGIAASFAASFAAADLAAQPTPLRTGRTVTGTLAAGDTARYSIQAGGKFFAFGAVDQIGVDVAVRVLGPDGRQVTRVDALGRGEERFSGELTDAGTYTIEVIPVGDATGNYAITIHRLEPLAKDPRRLADQLLAPYDGRQSPGAAVRVWRNGRVLFSRAVGMANLTYDIPFETNTRTNIGSTSKQFTAFAIMLQAERGALSLDDDIREHIPELPEFRHTITVRHLITHTSGLREFINLLMMTGRRIDHGDWIDRSELIRIVQRQPALQNEPGSEFNYNNTAFGLAALIVERTSGKDFHVFMQENVFGPIGMTRTQVRPSPDAIVPGQSEGYAPGKPWYRGTGDIGGAVGAGSIYSTVEDLQKWVENYATPRVGSAAIVAQMTTPNVLTTGDTTEYGYGLFIDKQRGLRRVHHGGADVAHRSMLAWYPEIGAGITTQSNHAGFDGSIAFRLAAAFFADVMEPEEDVIAEAGTGEFDPASYDPEDFDDYVGRYALDASPSFVLSFTREGDTLYAQATGQPRFRIVPTSDSSFRLIDVPASVTFRRNDDGEVEGLTLYQGGSEAHATRLDEDVWKPTVAELRDFTGRYYSDEIETFYTIELKDDALVVRHARMDETKLAPAKEDTFTGGILTFTFERDRSGRLLGFYLSNVRTRDVRFERVR